MKYRWDNKYLYWGVTAVLVIICCIVFYSIINHWDVVAGGIGVVTAALRPIAYGLIMAYLLCPIVTNAEQLLFRHACHKLMPNNPRKAHGVARICAIVVAWSLTVAALVALVNLVLPELVTSVESIVRNMPEYIRNTRTWAEELLKDNPDIEETILLWMESFSTDFKDIAERIAEYLPSIDEMVSNISGGVFDVLRTVLNLVVGIIVSFYVLKDKEMFTAQCKKVLYGSLNRKHAFAVIDNLRLTHRKFGGFILGKLLDSLIIGLLCVLVLSILNVPYAVLVSVVVGVTNIIPFFGPFIGAIPSAFLILLVSPLKCLVFIVVVVVLQQFDGNILGPKILGDSTGLSSFWVLFAILVCGAIFGVWGMLCGVPVFAVLYALVKEFFEKRLSNNALPVETSEYQAIDHIEIETGEPIYWVESEDEQ